MSKELQSKLEIVEKYFQGFSNYIELHDIRDYLLFTLNSQVSRNVLAQLGLGGQKDSIIFPYNPTTQIHYQKISLLSIGALIVYVKCEALSEKFIIEKDDPVFTEYLRQNERELAFRGKEKVLLPKISDCSNLDDKEEQLILKIDDLYHDLESFMAVTEPNILFVLDAPEESQPDLLFAFNLMPEFPGKPDKKVLKVDVFLDKNHKTREIKYLKREEDYSLKFLNNIKDIGHSELFKSAFSLVLHLKSFKKP